MSRWRHSRWRSAQQLIRVHPHSVLSWRNINGVQIERKSRDLWINYTAQATCLVKLESVEILDEDAGDYATHRDTAVWVLDLSGNAYSSGNRIDEVASLRLDTIEGDAPA